MTKKVEIYSRSNCSYCDMAKNFFDLKGIDYEVYSADDPDIFIDDKLIGGYTDLIDKYTE